MYKLVMMLNNLNTVCNTCTVDHVTNYTNNKGNPCQEVTGKLGGLRISLKKNKVKHLRTLCIIGRVGNLPKRKFYEQQISDGFSFRELALSCLLSNDKETRFKGHAIGRALLTNIHL